MEKEPWYLKIGRYLSMWMESGGLITVCVLAALGILCAVVGYYGTVGFNWKMFLFAELPLYVFCTWAIVSMIRLVRKFNR